MQVGWVPGEHMVTISISLAAVSAIHAEAGVESPVRTPQVRATLEGAARTGKVAGVREQVVVTPEHLHRGRHEATRRQARGGA